MNKPIPHQILNAVCETLGLESMDISRVEIVVGVNEAPTVHITEKKVNGQQVIESISKFDLVAKPKAGHVWRRDVHGRLVYDPRKHVWACARGEFHWFRSGDVAACGEVAVIGRTQVERPAGFVCDQCEAAYERAAGPRS